MLKTKPQETQQQQQKEKSTKQECLPLLRVLDKCLDNKSNNLKD